ncbi:solute carrier organic anion transporter family member 5A1b [Chanos chanos]|uniref:Solute carrier organic anion transporter family member 5A1b n=1 Tax=Chanos chanos TaxID=29144 RepID=A0A6J2V8D5_CHACN|nr:receptor-type tyrosine-protein phosphatase N2-like [Chanos chanos]
MEFFHILLFLWALQAPFSVSADRKFGCLFEKAVCEPYEICVNDGMFGRCQATPVSDLYTYDVTPSVLQRFRTLLQKLSHRGLTWEDDVTQQILSREFSKLHKISLRPPESRLMTQDVAVGDRKLKPSEVELSRSLQKYLQLLGLLPKSVSKSGRMQMDVSPEYYHSAKLQNKGIPPEFTPESSYSPSYPDLAHYENQRVFSPSQGPDGTVLLMAALQQYLTGKVPLPQEGGEKKGKESTDPVRYSPAAKLYPLLANSLPGKPQRTKSDRLRPQKPDSAQPTAQHPLTPVDETFIQNVLLNVGKHNVDVGSLSPADLDQLARLIADALQVVEQERYRPSSRDLQQVDPEPNPGPDPGPDPEDGGDENYPGANGYAGAQEPGENQDYVLLDQGFGEQEPGGQGMERAEERQGDVFLCFCCVTERQTEEQDKREASDKELGLLGKLLDYLDKTSLSESTPSEWATPVKEGRGISVETVKSRTVQREAGLQKKAGPPLRGVTEVEEVEGWVQAVEPPAAAVVYVQPQKNSVKVQELQLDVKTSAKSDSDYGYIITDTDSLPTDQGLQLMELLARRAKIQLTDFLELYVEGPAVTFKVKPNAQNVSTADVAKVAVEQKKLLEKEARVTILEAGVTEKSKLDQIRSKYSRAESTKFLILTIVSIVCIIGVLMASTVVYCLRHRSHHKLKEKLTNLGSESAPDATATYQELCRQRMAVKPSVDRAEPVHSSRINSVSSQLSDGPIGSPSARTSVSSWSEEPAHSNMDISTGHMILSYMEDHLKNKNRLEKEWEALCAYQAEPNATTIGQRDLNAKKNRTSTVIAYDHSRITLRVENSQGNSDYINASPIMDHDPRNPAYIATQGPLPSTVADFWQMVWESGCVVIVMLTPLTENGVKQCYHYWPDEGSNLYHIYEVNLVSEHVWCDDFLVRSFYLKNMQTNETRTVTQFHYHTWLNCAVPESSQSLLDFRRKVNKCYRGRSCPIIVHCSDGAGRTGTYILIDMVLNKMAKGAKEIDIAATLEHLRDQRPGMVQTKEQFEFALTAVAEEVNAILKALPQ